MSRLPNTGTGIVCVEVEKEELIPFQMQMDQLGTYLLESLIRYSVTDLLHFKNLSPRIVHKDRSHERIILITNTAYDAILIAREIMLFRHLRPITLNKSSLKYKIGVHYSESLLETEFAPNQPDVEISRNCARLAEPSEIICSPAAMEVAEKDRRSESVVLSEFKPFLRMPGYTVWNFQDKFVNLRNSFEHSYFLSYSHKDVDVADHIELLLLRHGRTVRRDEKFLLPDTLMDTQFIQEIKCCNTFIALYSSNYAESDVCLAELNEAKVSLRGHGSPRIGVISMDIEPPFTAPLRIYYKAENRQERENVIRKLIAGEHT